MLLNAHCLVNYVNSKGQQVHKSNTPTRSHLKPSSKVTSKYRAQYRATVVKYMPDIEQI